MLRCMMDLPHGADGPRGGEWPAPEELCKNHPCFRDNAAGLLTAGLSSQRRHQRLGENHIICMVTQIEEEPNGRFHLWGVTAEGESVLSRVNDFRPYFLMAAPTRQASNARNADTGSLTL